MAFRKITSANILNLSLSSHDKIAEFYGKAYRKIETCPVLEMKMEVRLQRMSGVTTKTNGLASPNFFPLFHRNASFFEVRKVAVFSFAMLDDDKVALEDSDADVNRPQFRIVANIVLYFNDQTVCGS